MNKQILQKYAREVLGKHPELKAKLMDILQLAFAEIDDGQDEGDECEKAYSDIQELLPKTEGLYKPGGKYIGIISKEPKRMVKCPKCKGTGDMSATKSGIPCDKCHGQGKLYIDPGTRQKDDIFEVDSTKTTWEKLENEATSDHCEKCYGEEYESGTGELKKYLGHDLCYRCFDKILSGKANINDLEEMSTVAGVAGFNAPMGGTDKNGIKHNISIKEATCSSCQGKGCIHCKNTGKVENDSIWAKPSTIKEEQKQNYRVSVSMYDRMHTMVSRRNELILKTITVVASSPESAKEIAIKHFRKLHFSVKDAEVIKVTENTMKSFKHILNEIDLSTKDKTLTHFLTQVSQTGELGKQFGANYKPETFMDWLRSKVENYGLSVSKKYMDAMEKNLQNKNPMQAQSYVYNALLKGAGLGLTEEKKEVKKKKL